MSRFWYGGRWQLELTLDWQLLLGVALLPTVFNDGVECQLGVGPLFAALTWRWRR